MIFFMFWEPSSLSILYSKPEKTGRKGMVDFSVFPGGDR
jgi:hypothetical protein